MYNVVAIFGCRKASHQIIFVLAVIYHHHLFNLKVVMLEHQLFRERTSSLHDC